MESLAVIRIKKIISDEGESPNSFALKIGVTPGTLYNLFKGGQPRLSTIDKIIEAYPTYTKEWILGTDTVVVSDILEVEKLRAENAWLRKLVAQEPAAARALIISSENVDWQRFQDLQKKGVKNYFLQR